MLVADVFVCHASEDRVMAEAAVVALESQGHRCWVAPRDVPPGADYAGAILSGISNSRVLLLIFSHRANESSHVPREVERAVHRGMPIIPFRLDDVEPTGPLEYFISGAQWLDATSGRPEDQLPALVDAVAALLAPEGISPSETDDGQFSDWVREQLGTLILRFGSDLARDPRRLQAVLRDVVGEHPAEISALVTAAEEGVPEMLLESSDPGASATMERLARRLKERRALGTEASRWAVQSWAIALRIPPVPAEPTLDPPKPGLVSDAASEETRPVEPGINLTATVPADSPAAPAPEVKSIHDQRQPALSQARTPPRQQPPPRTMYPADFNVDYGDGSRNRLLGTAGIIPYVKPILLIPHGIALFFLGIAAFFVIWIGYFIVLLTGKRLSDGMHSFISGTIGWGSRTLAWFFSLVDEYPPFELEPAGYAAEWTENDAQPERNRLLALAGIFGWKFLLAFPHLIVLGIIGFAAFIAAWVGFWIILFTGSLPEGIHTFVEGSLRWGARVYAWIAGLTDAYPPFSLDS